MPATAAAPPDATKGSCRAGSAPVAVADVLTGNGLPQHSHIGGCIGWNDARHDSQIGMRLAVSSVVAQIRQGAGNSTAASASMAVRNIKLSLASERGHRERYSTTAGKDRWYFYARRHRLEDCTGPRI